jgi:hypothetical protein
MSAVYFMIFTATPNIYIYIYIYIYTHTHTHTHSHVHQVMQNNKERISELGCVYHVYTPVFHRYI